MYISCRNLLKSRKMNQMGIVAGTDGLYRIIVGCQIVEYINFRDAMCKKQLIFIAGVGLEEGEKWKEQLIEMVSYLLEMNVSGIVLEIGKYILEIPAEIKNLCDAKEIPLLELSYEERTSDMVYEITKIILSRERILNGACLLCEKICQNALSTDLLERATFYGYQQRNKYFAAVFESDVAYIGNCEMNRESESELFFSIIEGLEYLQIDLGLWQEKQGRFYFILPTRNDDGLEISIEKILDVVRHAGNPQYSFSVGVGPECESINDFYKSISEAGEALAMIRQCHKTSGVRFFENTGVYRLLFEYNNVQELEEIYQQVMGPLIAYDSENESKLLGLLNIYLDKNRNLTQVANDMGIPRNTVRYRIRKIEEILNMQLDNVDHCFNLRLAYKIRKYLDR